MKNFRSLPLGQQEPMIQLSQNSIPSSQYAGRLWGLPACQSLCQSAWLAGFCWQIRLRTGADWGLGLQEHLPFPKPPTQHRHNPQQSPLNYASKRASIDQKNLIRDSSAATGAGVKTLFKVQQHAMLVTPPPCCQSNSGWQKSCEEDFSPLLSLPGMAPVERSSGHLHSALPYVLP